jgi:hypothetical protein
MFVENRSRGLQRNSFVVAGAGGLCGMTEGADALDVRPGGQLATWTQSATCLQLLTFGYLRQSQATYPLPTNPLL